jgi:YD repeat-containing protein
MKSEQEDLLISAAEFECVISGHTFEISVKGRSYAKLCSHCLRVAHFKNIHTGIEYLYTYDNNGNEIEIKTSDGKFSRYDYDDKRKCIHFKSMSGSEMWCEDVNRYGTWTYKKPENWQYEKYVK